MTKKEFVQKFNLLKLKPNNSENSEEEILFGFNEEECVKEIRHRIFLKTQLTASAGIACNLRLAKACSDINKPNGQFKLESDKEKILDFIGKFTIRKVNGIGPSTSLLLECYGVNVVQDLYEKRDMIYLLETRNTFEFLMMCCRGLGSNKIVNEYDRKSLGHER